MNRTVAELLPHHAPGCPARPERVEVTQHPGKACPRCQDCGAQVVLDGDLAHNLTAPTITATPEHVAAAANMRRQERRVGRILRRRRQSDERQRRGCQRRALPAPAAPTIGLTVARRSSRSSGRPRARRSASATRAGAGDEGEPEPAAAGVTFTALHAATPGLTGPARADLFGSLPAALQAACWRALRHAVERERRA